MHHALCFSDVLAAAAAGVLFVREENKKSSFALSRAVMLLSGRNRNDDNNDQSNQRGDDRSEVRGNASVGERETLIAKASITSCLSSKNSGSESPECSGSHQGGETFLFGGFELIANVKTVEVYVSRSNDDSKASIPEDSYLTTCKGIPARDIPPLSAPPHFISDGTQKPEGASGGIENNTEAEFFYKFILAVPGGPKPVGRVILKFIRSSKESHVHEGSIIVRTLKVKCRLSDPSASNVSQQQSVQQQSLSNGAANSNPGMLNNQSKDGINNSLAEMMAMMGGNSNSMMKMPMMGGNGMMNMPMAMQMNPQQQHQSSQVQMQQPSNQQQSNHQQEKNQDNDQVDLGNLPSAKNALGMHTAQFLVSGLLRMLQL